MKMQKTPLLNGHRRVLRTETYLRVGVCGLLEL